MTKRMLMGVLLSVAAAQAAEVGSLIFYDFTHEATEGGAGDGAFNLGRAYLTVTGAPSEAVAFKLQVDAGQLKSYSLRGTSLGQFVDTDGDTLGVSSYSLSSADAGYYLYVKNACVDWTSALGKWTFGMQGMNLFNVQEATFGNRFLEKPLMDLHGFSSSADLGVGFAREIGPVKTSLLYTNGGGYKRAESDKYKKLSLQVAAGETALNKKDGWNAGVVFSHEPFKAGAAADVESHSVLGFFGGWAGAGARVGVEVDGMTTTGATDLKQSILGLYGDYKLSFAPGYAVYGSLDVYDPDTDAGEDGTTTIIAGFKASPVKGLVIAPNVRTTSYQASGHDADLWYRLNFEFKL